jgi:hypothetical protein
MITERTAGFVDEDVVAHVNKTILFSQFLIISLDKISESPTVRDDNVLTSRKLVRATAQSFNDVSFLASRGADRKHDLSNLAAGNKTVRLSESVTHTGLQSIGTSARKHLVDTENVVRVATHTEVETVLGGSTGHVLVDNNTSSFESFRRKLFFFTRNEVTAERKLVSRGLLVTGVEDSQLSIWDTTAVARLDVRLVLTVSVAACRS